MSTCACGKPYPGQLDGRPWTLPVCGSCFVAVDAVANAFYYIVPATARIHGGKFLDGGHARELNVLGPMKNPLATHEHVAELLVARPALLHAIEAAKRLGAAPTQIRELCAEIEPLMRPDN